MHLKPRIDNQILMNILASNADIHRKDQTAWALDQLSLNIKYFTDFPMKCRIIGINSF